jgi:hypothetical protein
MLPSFYIYFWRLKALPEFGSARKSKTTCSAANSVVDAVVLCPSQNLAKSYFQNTTQPPVSLVSPPCPFLGASLS